MKLGFSNLWNTKAQPAKWGQARPCLLYVRSCKSNRGQTKPNEGKRKLLARPSEAKRDLASSTHALARAGEGKQDLASSMRTCKGKQGQARPNKVKGGQTRPCKLHAHSCRASEPGPMCALTRPSEGLRLLCMFFQVKNKLQNTCLVYAHTFKVQHIIFETIYRT